MLDRDQAAALEALVDDRLRDAGVAEAAAAGVESLLDDPAKAAAALEPWRSGRRIEWVAQTVAQGDVLAAFTTHCRDALEDVEVLEQADDLLVARWRRETSRIELRAGLLGFERLASGTPTLLLADVEGEDERLASVFVDDAELRGRLAVCDLARLERYGAVRSSVFVYLEWFLRDAYGVKVLPAARFTQGLIDRGVISLGMG